MNRKTEAGEPGSGPTPAWSWRDLLRPMVHRARRTFYRLGHPWRRRQALRLMRSARPVESAAFICLGNICRSPYAAAVAEERMGEGLRVLSAGLLRGGRSCPAEAVEAAGERGLDLDPHVSQRVEGGILDGIDLVVVMDPRQRRALLDRGAAPASRILVLGDVDPSTAGGSRTIPDPYGKDLPLFREVYDRIDRCMAVLERELVGEVAAGARPPR